MPFSNDKLIDMLLLLGECGLVGQIKAKSGTSIYITDDGAVRRRDNGIDAMANSLKTHGRWTFKDERYLIALAASQTPLEIVAVKFHRSVDSVRRKTAALGISLPVLDEPRPKIRLEAKGSKIALIDVDQVSEPGEYAFRDGVIRIKRKHLNIWKSDPEATFTIVRFVPATGAHQIYGLCADDLR